MSLTEIMSAAKLSVYPTVALVLFLLAFGLILWRTFRPGSKEEQNHAANLPLEDGSEEVSS